MAKREERGRRTMVMFAGVAVAESEGGPSGARRLDLGCDAEHLGIETYGCQRRSHRGAKRWRKAARWQSQRRGERPRGAPGR
ncbi:hypothetical protein E2562_000303 [Oryza meyeriana var. granulata]|uniref:Uncharacterized protein n=1 Tax=Oryza meyeriana var. granulata TaxID=110450 RepID=A0A6G1CMN8_9ORYZ|nr:hypothetical protein E2562_000303 [Oryza meyeriana var. granulata]